MDTIKVFTSDDDQIVRIPQHLRFQTETVYIQRIGSAVVLLPTDDPWGALFHARARLRRFPRDTRAATPAGAGLAAVVRSLINTRLSAG